MSITETRPAAAGDPAPTAPAPRPAIVDWFTSADHKQIGVAYLLTSLAFAAVAGAAALVLRAEQINEGIDFLKNGKAAQYVSLLHSSAFFLFVAPAFVGLATYLVPLQIGARRLAFPRLNATAYWLYLGGGAVVVASYLVHGGPYSAQALFVRPAAAQGGQASDLWLLGMGAVAAAAIFAAIGLVTTLAVMRAPGMTLDRVPVFSWTVAVAGVVIALATPAFVVGLVLHGINLNHGGRLWEHAVMGNVWQHTLWLSMRPELLILPVFGAGVVSEVVPTFARKRLLAYKPALALLGASGALTFAVWASDKVRPGAPLAPTFSVASVLFLAPIGLLMLMWLGTLGTGRPRPSAALANAAGFVLMMVVALAGGISALVVPVKAGSGWSEGHFFAIVFLAPVFALTAGLYYWAPKIWGRYVNEGLGYLQFLLLLAGGLASTVPWYTGLRDTPRYAVDLRGDALNYIRIVAAGDALLVLALLLLVANLAGVILGKGRAATPDAWDAGATLEWVADSPPAPWNFTADAVPPIRSEQPVLDLRADGGDA